MPSDRPAVLVDDGAERRLHPLSWLFVVLKQLKSFALPLLVLLFTGRGNRFEFVGLIGVASLAAIALVQYVTYRFRLGPEGVVISSGVLQRTRRDIPYERIHNVVLHQSLLHRLFGVAEVRLESAGGTKAEGEMRVLSLADAQAIGGLIRERGVASQGVSAGVSAPAAPVAATLLRLDAREVVRLGLISNRGMVLVAAAFGALWQLFPDGASPDDAVRWVYAFVTRESAHLLPGWLLGPAGLASASFVLLIVALVIVRALSVALAVLQFHGFTLDEVGRQLRIERGLLTRVRLHLPRRRIQAWRVQETLLHRWFGRQSLRVDNAGGEGEDGRGARDLAPLATPAVLEALITHLLSGHAWPPTGWRPLHPRAWRRLVVVPSVIIATASAVLAWRYGAAGLVMLGGLPIVVLRARLWADHTGYAEVDRGLIAVREGWLNKSWRFVEVRKLQSLRVTESPFDRRLGMATLWLDTAGARSRDGVMRIPFLPTDEARALHNRLARDLDGEQQGSARFS